MEQVIPERFAIGKRWKRLGAMLVLLPVLCYGVYRAYEAYQESFGVEVLFPPYHVGPPHDDDTLRVCIIGDSWAEYHASLSCDTIFQLYANKLGAQPVLCTSRGHGGKMTKEIYRDMFADRTVEHAWEKDYCTQPLLEQHPDYCVVMAGINDLCWQRPVNYYIGNYRRILQLLLDNDIRPVVMEVPAIDVESSDKDRGFYKYVYIRLVSLFSDAGWNEVDAYRQAMRNMLKDQSLVDKVLFIPASWWNEGGVDGSPEIYLDDRLHLNMHGYHVLDSCIVSEIIKDNERIKRRIRK